MTRSCSRARDVRGARRRDAAAAAALVLALAACGGREPDVDGAGANQPADTSAPRVAAWRVTSAGIGPVRVGMTLDEANAVLGGRLSPPGPLEEACDFVEPRSLPADVAFMVVEGRIARLDVRDSTVLTEAGARVGDSEARVQSLYPGRVRVEPHHYTNGHYLVVRPETDTTTAIIFETDGARVTEYRAGRRPEVEWVEGCS